jgi:hypothetical protein
MLIQQVRLDQPLSVRFAYFNPLVLNSYLPLLRQMSNALTAVEEKALARELDLLPGSGCSSALHTLARRRLGGWDKPELTVDSRGHENRFQGGSGEAIADTPRHQGHELGGRLG